jgi:phosphate transport system permease protein
MTQTTDTMPTLQTYDDLESVAASLRRRPRLNESLIQAFLFLCGILSILTTIGIVYELGKESYSFFFRVQWEDTNKTLAVEVDSVASVFEVTTSGAALTEQTVLRIGEEQMFLERINGTTIEVIRGYGGTTPVDHRAGLSISYAQNVSIFKFITGTEWSPQVGKFGILPLLNATLMTTLFAMLIALPLGLSVAIFLSEYATERARNTLKPILEVLAGIPTVVYGFFALTFMTPLLRLLFGNDTVSIYNTASAGIVIGILIIPLVSSMSEDALSAVPRALREAAYGVGATKLETALKVVVPAAFSGIVAAFIVAISRAIGETMIVAIAAGAGPAFTFNPFDSAETMTGHIVRISGGDLSYDSIDYNSLFAIGLMLFFVTLGLNIISQRIVSRFREVYD